MRYIFPPRPKSKIKPAQLSTLDKEGSWLWQPKYDGDRCIAAIEGKTAHLGNRHNKWHSPTKLLGVRRELLRLKLPIGTHYLDGELISYESSQILVLFDVLQITDYLIGVSQVERLERLAELCGNPQTQIEDGIALQVSPHIWLAPHGFDGFRDRYTAFAEHDLIEGLVLRKKDSILDNFGAVYYEVDWQLRCRKGKKNYRF